GVAAPRSKIPAPRGARVSLKLPQRRVRLGAPPSLSHRAAAVPPGASARRAAGRAPCATAAVAPITLREPTPRPPVAWAGAVHRARARRADALTRNSGGPQTLPKTGLLTMKKLLLA